MDNKSFYHYKRNNLKMNWDIINNPWVFELFDMPFINFLNKIKGRKIFDTIMKLRFFITKKPVMPLLEYIVTTRCTMNCKECNTKIPEYNKNNTHSKITTFDEFKKDIDTLLAAVDYIEFFGFVGGEPLLASELDKMIKYAIKQKKIHHIFIATNGTILPNEKLLASLKNKKVSVQLSDYRNVTNIKGNVKVKYDEYKKLLTDNKIQFNNFQEKRGAVTWFSMPEIYKDSLDEAKLESQFNNCFASYVHMMCEGVISNCMLATYIQRNLEMTEEMKGELINIRQIESSNYLKQKLIALYSKPYSPFCNYCHFDNIKSGLPCGEQI